MSEPRITVITREGCHLCDDVLAVVRRVAADLGEGVAVVDVDSDPALLAEHGEMVPVTLVDGRRHDYHRVDEGRLRAALSRSARRGWLRRG